MQTSATDVLEVLLSETGDAASEAEATHVSALAESMQIEHARVQSKHDAMVAEYLASSPSYELPVAVRRARYSREFYYLNVRKVLQDHIRVTRALPRCMDDNRYIPLLSIPSVPDGQESQSNSLVDKVVLSDVPVFERMLFERWDVVLQSASYCTVNISDVFDRCLAAE